MKNAKTQRLFTVLLCGILLMLTVLPIHAAGKYMECSHAEFFLTLGPDGTLNVTEQWDLDFSGDAVTRCQRIYENPNREECRYFLLDVAMDGVSLELLEEPDDSRPEDSAVEMYGEHGEMILELYPHAQNEHRTLTVQYMLTNAVTLYEDTAEFQLNLSTENEGFLIQSMDVHVSLPDDTEEADFWVKGSQENTAMETNADGVSFHTEHIPMQKALTLHGVMPTELFPDSTRYVPEMALESLLDDRPGEPGGFQKFWHSATWGYNQMLARHENTLFRISMAASVWLFVLCLVLMIAVQIYQTKVYKPKMRDRYSGTAIPEPLGISEAPDRMPPALVESLMVYPKSPRSDMLSTMLDLTERGILFLDAENRFRVHPQAAELSGFETKILEIFAGDNTTEEIIQHIQEKPRWYLKIYNSFYEETRSALDKAGYLKIVSAIHEPAILRWFIRIAIAVLVFMGFHARMGWIIALPLAIFGSFMNGNAICNIIRSIRPGFTVITQEGVNRAARWKAYQHYLEAQNTLPERRSLAVAMECEGVKEFQTEALYQALFQIKEAGETAVILCHQEDNDSYSGSDSSSSDSGSSGSGGGGGSSYD